MACAVQNLGHMQHDIPTLLQCARLTFNHADCLGQQINQGRQGDINILHSGLRWQIAQYNSLLFQLSQR